MGTAVKSITELWREQGCEVKGAQRMPLLQDTSLAQGDVVSMLCQGFSLTDE